LKADVHLGSSLTSEVFFPLTFSYTLAAEEG